MMQFLDQVQQFQETYGMRFRGLEDPTNQTYFEYRLPDPVAPHPQDLIVAPDGTIAYWSTEYEPHELVAALDGLLSVTGVTGPSPEPSAERLLTAPVPNPFHRESTVRFGLKRAEWVELVVYDVRGSRVRTLVDGLREAGPHSLTWDGRTESGRIAGSGVYFVRLRTEEREEARRIVRLR